MKLGSSGGSLAKAGRVASGWRVLPSVASYHSLVKKQKKTARNVLRLEEGSSGEIFLFSTMPSFFFD